VEATIRRQVAMIDKDALLWFKQTFGQELTAAVAGTPFTVDLLVAIAGQETGEIWAPLRNRLSVAQILEICVGDTLDADKGRVAFPKTHTHLLAAPRGDEMFRIAHDALVAMSRHVPGYAKVAKRPHKFCHGYGIFQYDLQFFPTDPLYFLERRWREFRFTLGKCLDELRAAARRAGLGNRRELTDLERVAVAIAYNAGVFRPKRGLKQGHRSPDGRFYGENILDYLRMSQTISTAATPAVIPAPARGSAALPPPTPVAAEGPVFEVNVDSSQLRLRREPKIDKAKPSANVIAHLPDGHRVRWVSGKTSDTFLEVEATQNGAHLRGFAASKFLVKIAARGDIPVVTPAPMAPTGGVIAVFAPRKASVITRRTEFANALSLNEASRPSRTGTTPEALRDELRTIIDYLAVDKASHGRYQPRSGFTFCNIYAHDYCMLAGAYLPRVWWSQDAIERLTRGEAVEPRLGATIHEQRANDLFRWLQSFGLRFGWRQTGTLSKLQAEASLGAVALVIARRKLEGKSGHVALVVPEAEEFRARRDAAGEVIAPLQSQAGARNFRFGTGTANWWNGEQFAESAFWIHP
jgi:hypothetical protein